MINGEWILVDLFSRDFIDSEINYDNELLDELSNLEIKFINDYGKLFNLEGSEHSFMLEITEEEYEFEK